MSADETVRRRWRSLDEAQRVLADELTRRATQLLARYGELSIGEALEMAADELMRRPVAAPVVTPAETTAEPDHP